MVSTEKVSEATVCRPLQLMLQYHFCIGLFQHVSCEASQPSPLFVTAVLSPCSYNCGHFPLPLSIPLFTLSVCCPNWRMKSQFYILPASNDERPLISVYPCRWCTSARDMRYIDISRLGFILDACFASLSLTVCFLRTYEDVKHKLYWTVVWQALIVKWAVNSGGIMLQHPVLWPFVSAPFPTKSISPHDKPSDETKRLLLCVFSPRLW